MSLTEKLTNIADAIREKTGGTEKLSLDGMAEAIAGISAGGGNEELIGLIDGTATSFTIPTGTTKIRSYAFERYSTIEKISFPKELTEIGDSAFKYCTNLVLTSLPEGIMKLGTYVFQGCTNLALTSLPEGLKKIGGNAFENCSNVALTSFPEGITEIGNRAFYNSALPLHLSMPELTKIDGEAFSGTNVETISVGSKMGYFGFGNNAFKGCSKLTTLENKSPSAYISTGLFTNCVELKTLVFNHKTIHNLQNVNAFQNTPFAVGGSGGTVYVPAECIERYQKATNWSTLYAAGTCNFVAIEGSEYE